MRKLYAEIPAVFSLTLNQICAASAHEGNITPSWAFPCLQFFSRPVRMNGSSAGLTHLFVVKASVLFVLYLLC
jgi:hypothetical protein